MKRRLLAVTCFFSALTIGGAALAFGHHHERQERVRQKNLVSGPDEEIAAAHHDKNLINSWGIVVEDDVLLVANNGTGTSTFYDEDGNPFPRRHPTVINVNTIVDGTPLRNGNPTGLVLNPDGGFRVHKHGKSAPARLLFAEEDGTVAAWNPDVDRDDALVVINNNGQAVYKGLTIAFDGSHRALLFLADFGDPNVNPGTGKIDVYDRRFQKVTDIAISDPNLPTPPTGDDTFFTPFNVANIDDLLFVTYAVKARGETDELPAPCVGCGLVEVFTTEGVLLQRIESPTQPGQSFFSGPWGVSLAPFLFGPFSNQILIGNFTDGTLNAFQRHFPFGFLGRVTDENGAPLVIEGLWGIDRGKTFGQLDDLFCAAGPEKETLGLVGELDPIH